jgi:hypothetical protein
MMMTQEATNPAFAPSVVVAMSSPEPTMEADRINPGPRNVSLCRNEPGGSFTVFSVMR